MMGALRLLGLRFRVDVEDVILVTLSLVGSRDGDLARGLVLGDVHVFEAIGSRLYLAVQQRCVVDVLSWVMTLMTKLRDLHASDNVKTVSHSSGRGEQVNQGFLSLLENCDKEILILNVLYASPYIYVPQVCVPTRLLKLREVPVPPNQLIRYQLMGKTQ